MNPKAKTLLEKIPSKKKPRSQTAKFLITVITILIVSVMILSCAIVGFVGGALVGYIKTTSPIPDDKLKIQALTSFFYDNQGKQISVLTGSENKNRMIARYSEIPKNLSNAFIAIEDKRFLSHNGVDLKRTLGVAFNQIFKIRGQFGGSTITMQVVRAITGDTADTLQRKVQEMWRAIQLEKKLEKWQILELYENLIYIGENCYGVKSAARTYFNKNLNQLSLAECASLAGITNLPAYYDPLLKDGKAHNIERERIILAQMLDSKLITQSQYDSAMAEKLKFVKNVPVTVSKPTSKQSYFVDQVIRDVIRDLKAKGISNDVATTAIYNYGYKIYTTMDSKMQSAMNTIYTDSSYFPGGKNHIGESPQSSMVVIDAATSEVRAMYGGSGQKKIDSGLNRATQIERQAGSSFKPIAVYGPAIDTGTVTAATSVDDVPVYMNGVKNGMYPQNFPESYGVRFYRGLVSVRYAISRSINVVAAKVYTSLGSTTAFEYLTKSGIDMSGENNSYLSIALGGLTHGVNPLRMAAAYVPFDNNGIYTQPITYTKVVDSEGNIILDKLHDSVIKPTSEAVYSQDTAFIMTDMLRDVVGAAGTASYVKLHNSKWQSIPIAAKTGTTNDDYDRWFVGYTPKFTAAVWYGYDHPSTINVSGLNPSAVIWNAVLQKYYDSSQASEAFAGPPADIIKMRVCKYSGMKPTSLCYRDPRGSAVINEYFIPGTEPKDNEYCAVHVSANICTVSTKINKRNMLAGQYCPISVVVNKVFIKRKVPYKAVNSGDPYPFDWQYRPPYEYCNIHGPSSVFIPTPSPINVIPVPTETVEVPPTDTPTASDNIATDTSPEPTP